MTVLPALVFVLRDRIRGHLSQSGGVARWISRFTGAEVAEMDVPLPVGWERLRLLKWKARFLPSVDGPGAARWLQEAGATDLFERASSELAAKNLPRHSVLFLSAGSAAAPYTLALAKATGQKSAVVMTPSVLGTDPFNFAIVPAHDHPKKGKNLLTTLGAPNGIFPDELERKGWELAQKWSPSEREGAPDRWALLIGGDDGNYRISPAWVSRAVPPILARAEEAGADVYITTSRRTDPQAEEELTRLARRSSAVRMALSASKDPFNPVPGMMGLCSTVFVTEDSVSMASEAVTAGRAALLLRTERRKGIKRTLQNMTAILVKLNILPTSFLWGPPKFDALFQELIAKGFLNEMNYDILDRSIKTSRSRRLDGPGLNEAKRAAEWIVGKWDGA